MPVILVGLLDPIDSMASRALAYKAGETLGMDVRCI